MERNPPSLTVHQMAALCELEGIEFWICPLEAHKQFDGRTHMYFLVKGDFSYLTANDEVEGDTFDQLHYHIDQMSKGIGQHNWTERQRRQDVKNGWKFTRVNPCSQIDFVAEDEWSRTHAAASGKTSGG